MRSWRKKAEAPTPQALPAFDIEKMILPVKPEERRALFGSVAAGC